MLRDKCYEWFNATHREAWNDWSLEAATQDVANWHDGEKPDPQELYDTMKEIIAEFDALNNDDATVIAPDGWN